jgi:hypothetical protein
VPLWLSNFALLLLSVKLHRLVAYPSASLRTHLPFYILIIRDPHAFKTETRSPLCRHWCELISETILLIIAIVQLISALVILLYHMPSAPINWL